MKNLNLYIGCICDNPGPGAWSTILTYKCQSKIHEKRLNGYEEDTTNNRLYIHGLLNGLNSLKYPCIVHIYSNSSYLSSCIKNDWLSKWSSNGWTNAKGRPVKNQALWKSVLPHYKISRLISHEINGKCVDKINSKFYYEVLENAAKFLEENSTIYEELSYTSFLEEI